MTPTEFRSWRMALGLNMKEAAAVLGLSMTAIENYQRGLRRGSCAPATIPYTVELACIAVAMLIEAYTDEKYLLRLTNSVGMPTLLASVRSRVLLMSGQVERLADEIRNKPD